MIDSGRPLSGMIMINRFKSPLLSLLTVLALLVQGMAFGGQAMTQVPDIEHYAMMMDDMHCDPGMSQDMPAMDCCGDKSPATGNSCCEGQGSCSSDCIHCLSISVTGALLHDSYWPEAQPVGLSLLTYIPHFHSISLPKALRPPIA